MEEDWGVAAGRIAAFFRSQPDVAAEDGGFRFASCRVTLTPQPDRAVGPWTMPRTRVRMEGREEDVRTIHRRFFLQFLSAGG